MRGSGLSLERFIKGKAHKSKGEAKSKKRVVVRKAQRRREYEKVKRRAAVGASAHADADADADADTGRPSFYDRFFRDLQSGRIDVDADADADADADDLSKQTHAKEPAKAERASTKPDPFFKARKKADEVKQEKQRARGERQRRQDELDKKIRQRKKRHVKLSVRTASGQPVVRNHISDILSKLQTGSGAK